MKNKGLFPCGRIFVFCLLSARVVSGFCAAASVDFSREVGSVRPELHSAGLAPALLTLSGVDWSPELRDLNLHAARTHDWALQNGAVRVVDVHHIFPLLNRDPADSGSYYFAATDALLAHVQTNCNLKVFFRLGTSIEETVWSFYNNTYVAPSDYELYAKIFEGIIRHYTEGWANGFHWDIQYWEIWNEPENQGICWNSSYSEFCVFFATVLNHLKAKFPSLKIGGPAFASYNENNLKVLAEQCRQRSEFLRPDFISWHCYTTSVETLVDTVKKMRQSLQNLGWGNVETILDEWHHVDTWASTATRTGIESAVFTVGVLSQLQYTDLGQAYFYGSAYGHYWGVRESTTGAFTKPYLGLKMFGRVVRDYAILCQVENGPAWWLMAALSKDRRNGCVLAVGYPGWYPSPIVVSYSGLASISDVRCIALDSSHDLSAVDVEIRDGSVMFPKTSGTSVAYLLTFSCVRQ